MSGLRTYLGFRVIWFFMALHIFNCSIDAPDRFTNSTPEDLSINEMESIGEVVLEKVFGFTTALPEQDENDQEEGMDFKLSKLIVFYQPQFRNIPVLPVHRLAREYILYEALFQTQFQPETVAPPPKV